MNNYYLLCMHLYSTFINAYINIYTCIYNNIIIFNNCINLFIIVLAVYNIPLMIALN